MDIILPVSEVRSKLPELLKRIKKEGKHLIITKNGKPAGILLSPEELETLEIMADKKLLRDIQEGIEDIKKGRLYTEEEVFGDI